MEKALIEAADITGLEFDKENDMWGEFVHKIVNIVLVKVRREPLPGADHPVGLDKFANNLYNEISKQLGTSPASTILGIAGLGGSGKTALATHLYNLKCTEFFRSSFCSQSISTSLECQKQLLADLLGDDESLFLDTRRGRGILQGRLRKLRDSRVFVVLDDINNQDQIDSLLSPVTNVLVKGSLIVITSSDKSLLARYQVKWHNMKLLDEKEARELFCHHAFSKPEGQTGFEILVRELGYEDLVRELVKMCGGYPLALTVLGAKLFGKQKRSWKVILEELKYKFPDEIVEKIKATYNSLKKDHAKAAFLHVAYFFDEQDVQLVVKAHPEEACALLDSIETLGQKCLVEFQRVEVLAHSQMTRIKYNDGRHEDFCTQHWIGPCDRREFMSEDSEVGMHKFVKDMAKQIASEERDVSESYTENQVKSLDSQIKDWVQELSKGTTAQGSLRHLIVMDDCIQNFPQLNFLTYFVRMLRQRKASNTSWWPNGREGELYPLNAEFESSFSDSSGDVNLERSLESPLCKGQKRDVPDSSVDVNSQGSLESPLCKRQKRDVPDSSVDVNS